jgi:hypothetical protein
LFRETTDNWNQISEEIKTSVTVDIYTYQWYINFTMILTHDNGNWAGWGSWGSCSVTCETGAKVRTRTCTNPAPLNDIFVYWDTNVVYSLLSTSTCFLNYLLGHIGNVQEPVLLLDPAQFAPPYWGAGFVHVLLLLLDPVSHKKKIIKLLCDTSPLSTQHSGVRAMTCRFGDRNVWTRRLHIYLWSDISVS